MVTVNPTMTERSARLYLGDGGQCSSINNIPFLHKPGLHGQVVRTKPLLKKTYLKARMEFTKKHLIDAAGMWRLKFLVEIQHIMSDASLTLHIIQSIPSVLSSIVVAASCNGAAFHQQRLASFSGNMGQWTVQSTGESLMKTCLRQP